MWLGHECSYNCVKIKRKPRFVYIYIYIYVCVCVCVCVCVRVYLYVKGTNISHRSFAMKKIWKRTKAAYSSRHQILYNDPFSSEETRRILKEQPRLAHPIQHCMSRNMLIIHEYMFWISFSILAQEVPVD